MSDIVNLNKFRKAKKKAEKEKKADSNRIKFGRTKAEKKTELANIKKLDSDLDGKKLDKNDQED